MKDATRIGYAELWAEVVAQASCRGPQRKLRRIYMRIGVLNLIAIQGVLTSCMWKETTYYKPIGPGSYYHTACHGPDTMPGFKLRNELGMIVYTGGKKIGVTVHLGEGHVLRLGQPDVLIGDVQGLSIRRIPIAQLSYTVIRRFDSEEEASKYVHEPVAKHEEVKDYLVRNVPKVGAVLNATYVFPATDEFKGRPGYSQKTIHKVLGQDQWETFGSYMTEIDASDIESEKFVLKFPSVNLDGSVIEVPAITVEKVTELIRYAVC